MRPGYLYILANRKHGTIYVGVTSDLIKRVHEHRNETMGGFSKKFNTKHLVYFELHDRIDDAIAREKVLKKWRRAWKVALIEECNPEWDDLWSSLFGEGEGTRNPAYSSLPSQR